VDVTNTEAIGQMVGRGKVEVQAGDRVASRLEEGGKR
jgi:hypothetical protein